MSKEVEYYRLTPVFKQEGEFFATAAFINCHFCHNSISGMGGPDYEAVCLTCADVLLEPSAEDTHNG